MLATISLVRLVQNGASASNPWGSGVAAWAMKNRILNYSNFTLFHLDYVYLALG